MSQSVFGHLFGLFNWESGWRLFPYLFLHPEATSPRQERNNQVTSHVDDDDDDDDDDDNDDDDNDEESERWLLDFFPSRFAVLLVNPERKRMWGRH